MSNLLGIMILVSLVSFPFVLMVIGLLRRHKPNGIVLFMVGFGVISGTIVSAIPRLDELRFALLWVPVMYLGFKFFRYFQTKHIKKYLDCSRRMILAAQDHQLPSCEAAILTIIENNLKGKSASEIPENPLRAAETIVYRIALDMLDSSKYRSYSGILTPTGEQLLHICKYCLDYFLRMKYITPEEYDEHSDFLFQCEMDIDHYSLIFRYNS